MSVIRFVFWAPSLKNNMGACQSPALRIFGHNLDLPKAEPTHNLFKKFTSYEVGIKGRC